MSHSTQVARVSTKARPCASACAASRLPAKRLGPGGGVQRAQVAAVGQIRQRNQGIERQPAGHPPAQTVRVEAVGGHGEHAADCHRRQQGRRRRRREQGGDRDQQADPQHPRTLSREVVGSSPISPTRQETALPTAVSSGVSRSPRITFRELPCYLRYANRIFRAERKPGTLSDSPHIEHFFHAIVQSGALGVG